MNDDPIRLLFDNFMICLSRDGECFVIFYHLFGLDAREKYVHYLIFYHYEMSYSLAMNMCEKRWETFLSSVAPMF